MTHVSAMEINTIQPFLVDSLKTFYDFRKEDPHRRSRRTGGGGGGVGKGGGDGGDMSQSQDDMDFSQSQGFGDDDDDGFGSQNNLSAIEGDRVESRKLRRFR
jgi:hypothetical protein